MKSLEETTNIKERRRTERLTRQLEKFLLFVLWQEDSFIVDTIFIVYPLTRLGKQEEEEGGCLLLFNVCLSPSFPPKVHEDDDQDSSRKEEEE